jgi:hypothetical protein
VRKEHADADGTTYVGAHYHVRARRP